MISAALLQEWCLELSWEAQLFQLHMTASAHYIEKNCVPQEVSLLSFNA